MTETSWHQLTARRRTYATRVPLWHRYPGEEEERFEVPADNATLISSEEIGTNMHLPAIDLDYSCNLIPSATPDHFHLYLNKPVTWWRYKQLLHAMYRAGLIQKGFYRLSVRRRASFLRHPDHPKTIETEEEPF